MDKSAIEAIQLADAFKTANIGLPDGVFAHPGDWKTSDLERFHLSRRRKRGSFETDQIKAWAAFVTAESNDIGAACFIAPAGDKAMAVLNFGTTESPGHCDFTATLKPRATPAWAAVTAAMGKMMTQQDATLLLEDWLSHFSFHAAVPADGEEAGIIAPGRALRALRKITVKASSDTTAETSQYQAKRSTLEAIEASSTELDALPARIVFKAQPSDGLNEQSIQIRPAITRTDSGAVLIQFQAANMALVENAIALDFADKAKTALQGAAISVYVGGFEAL